MAVVPACATVMDDNQDIIPAAMQSISVSEAEDLAMARNYAALHSPGNWWSTFINDEEVDIDEYEHYALVKSPGSIYDSRWFSIEIFIEPFSVPNKSDVDNDPKYFVRVHHTKAWKLDDEPQSGRVNAKRTIFAMQQEIDEDTFEMYRDRLAAERFVQASKNEDDGTQTTHLNIYSFDMTRGRKRDLVSVGWEGFDRFGDSASTLDAFIGIALEQFPELTSEGLLKSGARSSSTHRVN